MIKGLEVIKHFIKNVKCKNCEKEILQIEKRLIVNEKYHNLKTEHYCVKCAKTLLRKIMIQLH